MAIISKHRGHDRAQPESRPGREAGPRVPRIRFFKVGRRAVFLVLTGFMACAIIEGACSIRYFVKSFVRYSRLLRNMEGGHTRYDDLLGWVSVPNAYTDDVYGPGTYLRTNSQGFRNARDFSPAVPAGKWRILCSGDSFTFGEGVRNEHTWCHQLSVIEPRLETINMGQCGYGIDQAYLWYKRDGIRFDHHVHLFTFITEDFRRMKYATFIGYEKPILRLRDGQLVSENVPVPRGSRRFPWLTRIAISFETLSSYRTMKGAYGRLRGATNGHPVAGDREVRQIALKVFEDLQRINAEKGSILVLVYLPVGDDYYSAESDLLRYYIKNETARRDLLFIDLVEELTKLSPQEAAAMFDDHYTPKGNAFIARKLYETLLALPQLERILSHSQSPAPLPNVGRPTTETGRDRNNTLEVSGSGAP